MDIYALADIEKLFFALADRTRLRILHHLNDNEACVADLTEELGESQPKISRHLAYLRRTGIVETRRDGKWIYYRISRSGDSATGRIVDETLRSLRKAAQGTGESARRSYQPAEKIYVQADMKEDTAAHHNDLEEFLL